MAVLPLSCCLSGRLNDSHTRKVPKGEPSSWQTTLWQDTPALGIGGTLIFTTMNPIQSFEGEGN